MPHHPALRALVWVSAALVAVLVALVAVGATVVRRPLPDHAGTAELPGLTAPVTVLRDALGVPSIYADDAEDLFRAQGYVHAQDRFFEMDYRRHVTAGRLSELVGPDETALAADRVVRTLGWRRVAEAEWDLLSASTRRYLTAYAEGVNAYLSERDAEALAVEYTVLGLDVSVPEPEPWDPVDSLAWLKAVAWDMRGNYDREIARARTYATLRDVDLVEDLFPRFPYDSRATVVPPQTPAEEVSAAAPATADTTLLQPGLIRALVAAEEALAAVPHLLGKGDGTGSNSWVVAGEHTATGAPILANDPHLSLTAPGIWSQMSLFCTQVSDECPFELSGFTFAGLPGVFIGHNADLAWGLTNLGADVTDLFIERTRPDEGTYLRDGTQVPIAVRTEVIEVNGGEPVEIEVRSTVHGPLISDVLGIDRVLAAPLPAGGRGVPEVALAWTALEPGLTADALFMLATAASPDDVAAAAAAFAVPSQNIVYATTDGQIGYQAPGRIPVRARVTDGPVPSDGTWPRPGWDSRYDWQGFVGSADMPSVVDPEQGYLVAANQPVTPPGVGPLLTADWDYGFRSERVRERLEELIAADRPITVEAMADLQTDAWSPYAAVLVPSLLAAPVADDFAGEGVDLLRDWDYVQDTDSAAAAYFSSVWANLLELTFWDDLPQEEWPSGDSRWLQVVRGLLSEPDDPWWDDRRTVNVVENRDEILSQALTTARLELTVALGKDADDWQWGRLHTAAPQHPVLGREGVPTIIRELVNPDPLPVAGGSSLVNATAWDAASDSFAVTSAPLLRMVVDLADLDRSRWVVLTGTSGHPGSVHYTDQFDTWAAGETYPWRFSEEAVASASVRELTLRPDSVSQP